jgi:hypothetical protein
MNKKPNPLSKLGLQGDSQEEFGFATQDWVPLDKNGKKILEEMISIPITQNPPNDGREWVKAD